MYQYSKRTAQAIENMLAISDSPLTAADLAHELNRPASTIRYTLSMLFHGKSHGFTDAPIAKYKFGRERAKLRNGPDGGFPFLYHSSKDLSGKAKLQLAHAIQLVLRENMGKSMNVKEIALELDEPAASVKSVGVAMVRKKVLHGAFTLNDSAFYYDPATCFSVAELNWQ